MNILTTLVFLPTVGALLCLFVPKRQVRAVALLASLVTFLLSLTLFGTFYATDGNTAETIFGSSYGTLHEVVRIPWITGDGFSIEYFLGMDGLSFPLFILTTFVSFLACWASWNFDSWKINKGVRAYFILFSDA